MKALSIDLGGSHAALAVVEDQTILASQEVHVDSTLGLKPVLPLVSATFHDLLRNTGVMAAECAGLAISICAMAQHNRVVATNGKFDDAPQLDLAAWCRAEFDLPLALENDARVALLGEWYAGAGQGADDLVMITLGTGVGGAVMVGGRLYQSSQVHGGCWGGHIPVLFGGRKCTCGALGCIESEASGWVLPQIAREWPGFAGSALAQIPVINFRAVFELARQGDHVATGIRDRCLQVWATGTVGLIHAYGPQRVIIGGGVMRSREVILPYIRQYVANCSWQPSGPVEVLAAALGNDAGVLGAVPLLMQQQLLPAPVLPFPARST
jgi:glucokinase